MNTPAPGKAVAKAKTVDKGLMARFAGRFGVDPERLIATMKATAFKQRGNEAPPTNEEMVALMIVADQYGLNPFTREIYAFRGQNGAIMSIIGVDGWIRLMNEHPCFDGIEFAYDPDGSPPEWCEVTIKRKDRSNPTVVREYLEECKRDTGPWKSYPRRMLRHRALVQGARIAFGFTGVMDDDEGEHYAISISPGVDVLPLSGRTHVQPPQAKTAEEPRLTDDQLEQLKERLAKTGLPDNLVLAKFEVGTFEELKSDQFLAVMKFVQDNAP